MLVQFDFGAHDNNNNNNSSKNSEFSIPYHNKMATLNRLFKFHEAAKKTQNHPGSRLALKISMQHNATQEKETVELKVVLFVCGRQNGSSAKGFC
jgi:hypothetical protein